MSWHRSRPAGLHPQAETRWLAETSAFLTDEAPPVYAPSSLTGQRPYRASPRCKMSSTRFYLVPTSLAIVMMPSWAPRLITTAAALTEMNRTLQPK
jgi:hypothetical protein